jgi:hypothetical protein
VGLGTTLYRRNFLGIAMGGMVASAGLVLALAAVAPTTAHSADGALLAAMILVFQLAAAVAAAAVLHRRHVLGAPIDSTEEDL